MKFDILKKSLHRNDLENHLKKILPHLSGDILDIGSKNRRYDRILKSKPYAIDIVENKALDIVQGDMCHLEFENERFDSVMCIEVLEYIDQPERALEEAVRVLKKGGNLLLSIPFLYKMHDDQLRYTENYLREKIERNFEEFNIITIGNKVTIVFDMCKDWINTVTFKPLKYFFYAMYFPFASIALRTLPAKNRNFVSGYLLIGKNKK